MSKWLMNPLVIFGIVWGVVFTLFLLHISDIFVDLNSIFLLGTIVVSISAVAGFVLGYYSRPLSQKKLFLPAKYTRLPFISLLLSIILLILTIEITTFRGIPLIWIFSNPAKTYVDYGIPTIHGFFNAIVIFTGTLSFWLIVTNRISTFTLFVAILCLLIPVLLLSRQVLFTLITQCFFMYIGSRYYQHNSTEPKMQLQVPPQKKHRINKRQILSFITVSIILFGLLGNIRTGKESLRYHSNIDPTYQFLPSIVLWSYMYLTIPINNLIHVTTQDFEKAGGMMSLSKFTPTVLERTLQETVWKNNSTPKIQLVVPVFNTPTYAFYPFVDFGFTGVIVFTFLLLFFSGYFFKGFVKRHSLWDLLMLVILNQILVFSCFDNLFLSWGISFQFVLAIILKKYLLRISALKNYTNKVRIKIFTERGLVVKW